MSYADTCYKDYIQISYPLGKSLICWKIEVSAKESFSDKSLAFQGFRFLLQDLHKDYGTKWDFQKHRN